MKKLVSLMLAAVMLFSLAACSSASGTPGAGNPGDTAGTETPDAQTENSPAGEDGAGDPDTVTVTGRDSAGEDIQVEVPHKPERVVVLDLANLDILDNLGAAASWARPPSPCPTSSPITMICPSWAPSRPPTWRPSWPVSPT